MLHVVLAALLSGQSFSPRTDVPENLVVDPRADAGGAGWTTSRDGATIEFVDGDAVFVNRNKGTFQQTVPIPVLLPSEQAAREFLARFGVTPSPRGE
jgi:hypothetical protein